MGPSARLGGLARAADRGRPCTFVLGVGGCVGQRTPAEPELGVFLDPLLVCARDLLRRRTSYVADADWVLGSLRWLVGTLHLLREGSLPTMILDPTPVGDAIERLYVQSSLWGYRDFTEAPLDAVMRAHAAKIWIARAMAEVPLAPSASAIPLATLSMLMRGHGLMRAWGPSAQ